MEEGWLKGGGVTRGSSWKGRWLEGGGVERGWLKGEKVGGGVVGGGGG